MVLQGVEAKAAVGAGGSEWAFVRVFALADAAKRRAYLSNPTIGIRQARVARRCGLRLALVPTAKEATAVAHWPVRDALVP